MKKAIAVILLIITTLSVSQAGTTTSYTIDVNGTDRTFIVYVPDIYDGSKPVPLMLNIHGFTMSDASQQNMMNYDPVADTANFITARPRGINNAWSQATTVSSGQADRDFMWDMIDSVKAWHNINPCKVYASGFSQGSFMSNILVLNVDNPTRAPVIAAIGSSSGGISKSGNPSYWNSKNPLHPTPVMHLHGDNDGTIDYNGGGTQNPASVDELMDFWVTHNNCNPTPTMTTCGSIDHYVWDGGDRGTRVEHYKVNGGGHSAPNNNCMNSAKTIWEFCSEFCLPYLQSTTCTDVPTISAQATDATICSAGDATFSVTAAGCEGTPITYQWQEDTGSGFVDVSNGGVYSGVTTNALTITAATAGMDSYQYRVLVESCCDVATSTAVTLTVNSCSGLTATISGDATICQNDPAQDIVFTGSGGTAPYTFTYTINGGANTTATTAAGSNTVAVTVSSAANTYTYALVDVSDGSTTTAQTGNATVTVNATPATPTASSNSPVCETASIDLASTTVGSATYDWTGPNTFSSSTQNPSITNATTAMAGTYSVNATENGCVSAVATTDVVVNTNSAPLVDIALTTGSNPSCSGQSLTFTASPTNGGTTPAYQWMVDGGNVGTDSPTFTTTTLTDGQAVTCTMTSNSACASPTTATSNTITINVGTTVTPDVSIALTTGSNPTCSGESLTFTATPTNGGTTPAYQWMVDGGNVGTDSPTFTTTTLTDGQVVSCTLTSNDACANPTTTTSNNLTVTVTSSASPAVNIAITNGGNPTCSGQSITFTATPTNGGTTPAYQWMVDGGNVGTDSPTFTTTTLADGQIVSCTITSSSSCASPTTASSNSITITISGAPVTPSVSIAITNGANPTCSGQSVTFTATSVNEGAAPTYQWMVNGGNAGTNSPVFTTTTLSDGQVISCVMTSNDPCANPTTATSNSLTISVTTTVTPTISIALTSGSNPTCPGQSLVFTATTSNEGSTPSYQWMIDGNNVGTNSPNFTSTTLTNGQVVSCTLTSNEVCTSQASATSNSITITIPANPNPSVSIALTNGSNPSCINESLTFTATPSNGGSSPSYQWTVDGANVGTDATTYTSSTLTNGQVVNCTITTAPICGSTNSSTATGIPVVINPTVTPSISTSITAGGNPIVIGQSITFTAIAINGGSAPIYQWKVNDVNAGANSTTFTSAVLSFGDVVSCSLTSNANCVSSSNVNSNIITIEPSATNDISQIRPVNTKYAKIVSTITNNNGATITSQGVVWSLTPNPTVEASNKVTHNTTGSGSFIDTIGVLAIETMYYVRSYVITSNGTVSYSDEEVYYSPPVRSCTPDPTISIDTLGIYPKSLPERENGDLTVNQTFTYAIPFRHTNEKGEVEEIDSIRLDDIVGLPAGLTYDCGRPICIFYPGELGCFTLSGTLPAEDFTSYEMEFEITKYGFARDVSVNGTYYGDQNLDTYLGSYGVGTFTFYVGIEAPVEPGEEDLTGIEGNSSSQLQIVHCSPNPFNRDINIKFITPTSGNVNFSITDLYGRQLFNSSIDAIVGENSVKYSLDELAEGTYYFTINNGTNKVTKMMVAIK